MNTPDKHQTLQQIAAIPAMERGKLSAYSFKDRSRPAGPYHKLQHWQDGKNHTRYVPAEELPAVQAALAGYAQYRQLTRAICRFGHRGNPPEHRRLKKKEIPPQILLAQEAGNPAADGPFPGRPSAQRGGRRAIGSAGAHGGFQIRPMRWWAICCSRPPTGSMPPTSPSRASSARAARSRRRSQGIFGSFHLQRDYYYHPGKKQGHYPADAALGLEVGYTPALARLVCLEGADEASYQKAEQHLKETGGITSRPGRFNGWSSGWAARPSLAGAGGPTRPGSKPCRSCMSAPTPPACRCAKRN